MEWMHPFAALVLCAGAVFQLLPPGGMKRCAALAIGLLLTLCWMDAVTALFHRDMPQVADAGFLAPSGYVMKVGGDSVEPPA